MATWRYVELHHPEAQRLADLHGVSHDLELAATYCQRFLETDYLASREALTTAQALFAAAVVAYGRTLSTGVRSGVSQEQIQRLPEPLRDLHSYFKDIRDKFVAHSVNAFEENVVKVYLVPEERGGPGVASIGLGHSRVATLSREDMCAFAELVEAVQATVAREMEAEQERLLEIVQHMPLEQVYAFPEPRPFATGGAPSRPRRRIGEG